MLTTQEVDTLIAAIVRRSPMFADGIGLLISADELDRIYRTVGIRFFSDLVKEKYRPSPTVGELLKYTHFGEETNED